MSWKVCQYDYKHTDRSAECYRQYYVSCGFVASHLHLVTNRKRVKEEVDFISGETPSSLI